MVYFGFSEVVVENLSAYNDVSSTTGYSYGDVDEAAYDKLFQFRSTGSNLWKRVAIEDC